MCFFGGGGSKPADPPPPARPPAEMNTQATPTSAEASGRNTSGDAVETNRRGRRILRIPLLNNSGGSGVQIPS